MLDEMRMRTAWFARAPQRCTSRLSKHFSSHFKRLHRPAKLATSYMIDELVPIAFQRLVATR
jgi:hypothetical protein